MTPAPNGTVIDVRRTSGAGSFAATCEITDGSGSCSVDVPTGANVAYTARISSAPAGYRATTTLGYGTSSSVTATPYEFETSVIGNNRQGDTIHIPTQNPSTASVVDANGRQFASALAVVRDNPPAVQQCGAKIALVLDQSASMANAGKEATLKTTVTDIISDLAGTTAQIAGYTFSSETGASHPLASMNDPADVASLTSWIGSLNPSDYTNWDSGLYQVAAGGYDLVVFVTDGNPTTDRTGTTASGTGSAFQFAERGIYSANAVKAAGTRVVALGIGVAGSGAVPNLAAVSGPTQGSDYYTASDGSFGSVLHELVTANCQGKLFLTKQIEPWNGQASDRHSVADWKFEIDPADGPATQVTTPGTPGNTIEFPLTFPSGSGAQQVAVRETDPGDYAVVQSAGKNAVCTVGGSGANIAVNSNAPNNTGFTVPVGPNQIVTCTVVDKEPKPGARIQVDKQWIVNGADPVPDGQQGYGLVAALRLAGAAKSFGTQYSGYTAGDQVAISEVLNPADARCRLVSSTIAGLTPASAPSALPTTVTLASGDNHYLLTNTVTCDARLTLHKVVDNSGGGSATIADFPLHAARGGSDVLSGPDPVPGPGSGLTGYVAAGSYTLSETGLAGYAPSAWQCVGATPTQVSPGVATVTIAAGSDVTCTVTNTARQPKLTLVKRVDHAGTSDDTPPSAWTLNAAITGGAPAISAKPSQPVPGDDQAAAIPATSVPVGTYQLSESGPGSYTSQGFVCDGSSNVVTAVSLQLGDNVTCTVVNRANAPHVTVTKQVYRLGEDQAWHPWDGQQVASGDQLRWVITATNQAGTVPFAGQLWTDSLTDVLAGTTGLSLDPADFAIAPTGALTLSFDDGSHQVTAATAGDKPLAGGASTTVTFEASVAPLSQLVSAQLSHLSNVVVPGEKVECPEASSEGPDCTTENPLTPVVRVSKSVDKLVDGHWQDWDNQVVRPGDQLRWTLAAHNVSSVPYAGPLASDPIDDVVAGTSLVWNVASFVRQHPALTGVSLSSPAPGPSGNSVALATLAGQQLGAGASTSVSFEATVRPAAQLRAAGLTTLDNTLLPADGIEDCLTAGTDCVTHNPFTPQVTLTKSVTKLVDGAAQDWDGKPVRPGDELTWTITVTNSSAVTATGQLLVDDLADAYQLTDLPTGLAVFTTDPSDGLDLALSGTTLTGSAAGGGLEPGDQVTVRYTGTVRPYADLPPGTTTLANTVVPRGDAECPAVAPGANPDAETAPDCVTTNDIPPVWTVAKTSNPPSGSHVRPGDVITYTLTVRNLGAAPATGIVVTDDLTGVLAHTSGGPAFAASDFPLGTVTFGSGTLTWQVGTLAPGATAAGTYRVTIAPDTWGQTLRNAIVGEGQTPPVDCATAMERPGQVRDAAVALDPCSTTHEVPRLAHLRLAKTLTDQWGGSASATDWLLVANGGLGAGRPGAPGPLQGVTGSADVDADVLPGTYALFEQPRAGFPGDAAGYHSGAWSCVGTENEPLDVNDGRVTLPPGASVICRIENTAQPAHLTLVKRLAGEGRDGAPRYSDAQPSDWLLFADGAGKHLEGPGDPAAAGAIANEAISAGTYRLSEAPRPGFDATGFTTGAWSCTAQGSESNLAREADGGWSVTVGLGQAVRCEVVNTEEPPSWTLTKSSLPASGSQVRPGETIQYSVTAHYLGGVPQDVTVTDDLSDVIGSADLQVASITPPPSQITAAGRLVWHVADFHEDATFSYSVTVGPGAYGARLRNVASGDGLKPPEQCSDPSTSQCTTTHRTPALPQLTLIKQVRGSSVTPDHWVLSAQPASDLGDQPDGAASLEGPGGIKAVDVLPGSYRLTERAARASELTTGSAVIDPAEWHAGLWQCQITSALGARSGLVLTSAQSLTLAAGDKATCRIVNSKLGVDLALTKSTPDLSASAVLDAPDTFDYRIAVTNRALPGGAAQDATGVSIVDQVPAHLAVTQLPTVPGWQVSHTGADADGLGGTLRFTQASGSRLAVGLSATFDFTVQVHAGSQGDTVNTACVTADQGELNPANNCDTVRTRTKALIVDAQAICHLDVAYLRYSVEARNVPESETGTLRAIWRDQAGNVVRTDTLTGAAATSGQLLWPGASVRPDGVSVGWPGWRVIRAGERPQFEDMILDPSLPSYQWRLPMTVTFEVNPSTTIATVYPSATPRCEATRVPGVTIKKTASVTTSGPGQSFDYTLAVANNDLGAAHDVTVTDEVPNYLKVTGIESNGTVSGVAARWASCDVTGRGSDGYGGTVTCRLDNVLGYQQQAPPITLHVQVNDLAANQRLTNTGKVCWTGEKDGCNSSTVTIGSAGLAATGVGFAGWAGGIVGALALGAALYLLSRQLRRRQVARHAR